MTKKTTAEAGTPTAEEELRKLSSANPNLEQAVAEAISYHSEGKPERAKPILDSLAKTAESWMRSYPDTQGPRWRQTVEALAEYLKTPAG